MKLKYLLTILLIFLFIGIASAETFVVKSKNMPLMIGVIGKD